MADGVAITAGSGTTILTDDTGAGGHAQVVKLAISTDGSGTLIPADATNGIDVDVTRLPALAAGSNEIGAVVIRRSLSRIAVQSGGLTTSVTAYSAGDQVGTQFTLANAARSSGGTGRIKAVTLTDANDIIGPYDVVITRASITLAADNAAYAISDADARNIVALIPLTGAYDLGNNRLCQALNLDIPYDCSGGTSLFAGLITRAGHTFFTAVTDLELVVWVERD